MIREYYLDAAATNPPTLVTAGGEYNLGNPGSQHRKGKVARQMLEFSREHIADNIGVKTSEIFFTSGGSESNNMAIKGVAFKNPKCHIITSIIEHPSVLKTCEQLERFGYEVTYLPVNKYGEIDLEDLENSIRSNTKLITIMSVNNEIGTIQNYKEIYNIAKKYNVLYHMDAVQAICCIPGKELTQYCDMLSVSGHKFKARTGTGFLFCREGIELEPLICGGSQEHGKRAGTENVRGIDTLARALTKLENELQDDKDTANFKRELLEWMYKCVGDIEVNGSKNSSNHILNVRIRGIRSEVAVELLSMAGVYVSSGSACSKGETSHVLKAIGLTDEEVSESIRFSFDKYTAKHTDLKALIEVITDVISRVRQKYK